MFPFNLDQLITNNNLNHPEHENTPTKIFLKIGACPTKYKKKLDEAIVKIIVVDLLILKAENFVKAKFIFIFKLNLY